MRNKLFIIFGAQHRGRCHEDVKPRSPVRDEPDLDILKRSPCLDCELYMDGAGCPHVAECSKIDRFQRVAAAHCTLYKDCDVFTVLEA
jgi:hypothetical protein